MGVPVEEKNSSGFYLAPQEFPQWIFSCDDLIKTMPCWRFHRLERWGVMNCNVSWFHHYHGGPDVIHALGTRNRASRVVVSCLIDKVMLAVLYLTGCREPSN